MKRLDVIHEIIAELQRWNCLPAEESTPGDNGYVANHILSKLEELGMTPPAIRVPCPTHYIDATGQVKQGEDSVLFVNEWEQE